jgi:hypothetical protein
METSKLNRSIYIIGILALLLIAQHLPTILGFTQLSISISLNIMVLLFTIIYFVQLQYNLSHYLLIDNIKPQIISIIITNTLMYLLLEVMSFFKGRDTMYNLPVQGKILLGLFMLIGSAACIIWIIQYIKLGQKLVKYEFNTEVRQLGYSFYLVLISFIVIIIFSLIKPLKPFRHIIIILELLPYWYTFKIYRKLLVSKNENT